MWRRTTAGRQITAMRPKNYPRRLDQYLQVVCKPPARNVLAIEGDTGFIADVVPTADLPYTSQPRASVVIMRDSGSILRNSSRYDRTRTYETHLPLNDVE